MINTPETESEAWSKAETHFMMAKAAMKIAARNAAGAEMAAEHLEQAAEALRKIAPTEKGLQ